MTTRLGLLAISCLIVAGLFLPLVVTVSHAAKQKSACADGAQKPQ